MNMLANRTRERQVICRHHAALLQALRERDQPAAATALTALVDYLRQQYLAAANPP